MKEKIHDVKTLHDVKTPTPKNFWYTEIYNIFIHYLCFLKKNFFLVYVCEFALLTTPKPLTVCITTNWKILKEMGISDHLTCLLRNLYAGQEATVRTGHGITDWFQIGKGVRQGCTLSPCLFNLHAEYIM